MVELDKSINNINRLILIYSEQKEREKRKLERESYEKLIFLLVDQKHRLQEFISNLKQIS